MSCSLGRVSARIAGVPRSSASSFSLNVVILERVAAAMGALEAAPLVFESARDVPQGGELLALPALMAVGLLRHSEEYALPSGFYGLSSVMVLLALMALARIASIEQLRYAAAGEWGNLLGLDRIPEVRTLREKLKLLCGEQGRAARWNAAWLKSGSASTQPSHPQAWRFTSMGTCVYTTVN